MTITLGSWQKMIDKVANPVVKSEPIVFVYPKWLKEATERHFGLTITKPDEVIGRIRFYEQQQIKTR